MQAAAKIPASFGTHSPAVAYRADIDGLRAIAVLAVVIFHFRKTALPNGFLGVDLFFVLSGFLITSIIVKEFRENRYSLSGFYERRVRRIMPALLLVLIPTAIVSLVILLPSDLVGFSKSLISTLGFVSNIYFWRDTNYFAPIAETKPLLHMWSLSVEEQFYIFYPLILIFFLKYLKNYLFHIVFLICIISYGLNVFFNYVGGASPAFFMFPTRAWELCAGALLVFVRRPSLGNRFAGLAAGLGIILLSAGFFLPSIAVLGVLPLGTPIILGTMLILWSGLSPGTTVNGLLGARPLVEIGKISYSLYLWHWPIVVLLRYYWVEELSFGLIALSFAAMLLLSWLSTNYVEAPARSRKYPFRRLMLLILAISAILIATALSAIAANGFPSRLNAKAAEINKSVGTHYRCPVSQMFAFGFGRACAMNLPGGNPDEAEVILLGNSHAQMYAPIWHELLKKDSIKGMLVPINGCLPTPDLNLDEGCMSAARANLNAVKQAPAAKMVIVAFNWDLSQSATLVDNNGSVGLPDRQPALIVAMDNLISEIQASGKSVIVIGPIATPNWDVASETSRRLAFGHALTRPTSMAADKFFDQFSAAIDHFGQRADIVFLRPDLVQCDKRQCYFIRGGKSYFSDGNHLAAAILPKFSEDFSRGYHQWLTKSGVKN